MSFGLHNKKVLTAVFTYQNQHVGQPLHCDAPISTTATHFFVTWSVVCLSVTPFPLKPFDGCRCHLADRPIHRVRKNIPNIIDCHLKKRYPILIIFGTNISSKTGHQMTVYYFTSFSVCLCTTWGKQNQRNMS